MARIELAADYLLAHFTEFIQRFEPLYLPLLDADGRLWLSHYQTLSLDAKRLLLRLLSRKGQLFALDTLHYAEITDVTAGAAQLLQLGFLTHPTEADSAATLATLTKAELWHLITSIPASTPWQAPAKSAAKAVLLQALQTAPIALWPLLQAQHAYVQLSRLEPLYYMLFLFFGDIQHDLSALVLRDLGVMPAGNYKQHYQARFVDATTAQVAYFYSAKKAAWRALSDAKPTAVDNALLLQWYDDMARWPEPVDERTQLQHEQLCYQLGRQAERLALWPQAIQCYRASQSYAANERLLRIFQQQGDQHALAQQLAMMVDDPSCDEELALAQDIAARHGKPRQASDLTKALQQAPVVTLDESFISNCEAGVVAHYQQQGLQAWHSENELWLTLFGLWFWQELFEADAAAVHSEFDWRPRNLSTGLFYQQQQAAIEQKLAYLTDPQAACQFLLRQFAHAAGRPNAIFRYSESMLQPVLALLQWAPTGSVAAMLRQMASDFRRFNHGYPDLLVLDASGIRFVEVKGPGDVLRRHQLTRLRYLQQLGFVVGLQRVEFGDDPTTVYAVVDVETTGGRSRHDRITEIAIVRVQAGRIIDRFSQLIQPTRPIPSFITRLTGISNAMVATQPTFAALADDLAQRLAGCIFVAHNVKFDYGFVQHEFERAGVAWRAPQLCTVVQSRRFFPRLPSYGLAALASHFGLTLTEHHRALADATATAELLLLIQVKRRSLAGGAAAVAIASAPVDDPADAAPDKR